MTQHQTTRCRFMVALRFAVGNSDSNHTVSVELINRDFEMMRTTSGATDQVFLQAKEANNGDLILQGGNTGNLRVANTSMAIDTSSNTATGLSVASSGLLHVATDDNVSSIVVQKLNGSGSENALFFLRGSSGVGSIRTTDSATAFNTSSDHRLKENVTDMTGAIDRVKALSPKRFNFIVEPDVTVDGFLAHEAQAVVPEAVHGTHNEVDDDGNAVMQGIDQAKLVPLLTAALKESITKIETLETEMTALKARVTALENA